MSERGRISDWNDERGFGFITPADREGRVFAHISAFSDRSKRPALADSVSYEPGTDSLGRLRASNIAYIGTSRARRGHYPWIFAQLVTAGVLIAAIGALAYHRGVSSEVLLCYVIFSLITFFTYSKDKSAALAQAWRTSESTLHLLSLVGGWPGALAAQISLRHKTRKTSFQLMFWLSVVMNYVFLAWLTSPNGIAITKRVFASN